MKFICSRYQNVTIKLKRTMAWSVTVEQWNMCVKNVPTQTSKTGRKLNTHHNQMTKVHKSRAARRYQWHTKVWIDNVLPQMGCWQLWGCQPLGYQLTSRAQTQKFWGSGHKAWCRSPGKWHFPLAYIPWSGKRVQERKHKSLHRSVYTDVFCFVFTPTKWSQLDQMEDGLPNWHC